MKVYFNEVFQITKVETDETYEGTIGYNLLNIYIPQSLYAKYETILPEYSGKLPSGRTYGAFGNFINETTDDGYIRYYGLPINDIFFTEKGTVTFTISFKLQKAANDAYITKTTASVKLPVFDAVMVNNDHIDIETLDNTFRAVTSNLETLESAIASKTTEADLHNGTKDITVKSVDTNKFYTQYIGWDEKDFRYIELSKVDLDNNHKILKFMANDIFAIGGSFTYNGYPVATQEFVRNNVYNKTQADNKYAKLNEHNKFTNSNEFIEDTYFQYIEASGGWLVDQTLENATFTGALPKYLNTPLATIEDTNNKVNKSEFEAYKTTHNAEVEAVKTGIINRLNTIENAIKSNNIDFDTLQEISDWITANMSSDDKTLIEKITDILNRVGILETSDTLRDEAVEQMGARIDEKIAQVQPFITEWLNDIKPYFENIKASIDESRTLGGYKLIDNGDGTYTLDIKSV